MFSATKRRGGNRFGPGTVPALEPVANRPIAHHVRDALTREGIEEIAFVGSAEVLAEVRDSLAAFRQSPSGIEYVVSDDGGPTVGALRAAAPVVGNAACLVHSADGLLDQPLTAHLASIGESATDLLLLGGGQPPRRGPMNANGFGSGSSLPRIRCDTPVAIFAPGIFEAASRAPDTGIPSGLDVMARFLSDQGGRVGSSDVECWRAYWGDPHDLLEVNRLALEALAPTPRPVTGLGNRIEGRVQIDRSASVTRSVIVGPAVVGPGAEVTDAYIGPYTAIGARARIEGSEIERSIISPGARVVHVGPRLVCSVVGRRASVFRDFSLPRALRLQVSDGNEVALC